MSVDVGAQDLVTWDQAYPKLLYTIYTKHKQRSKQNMECMGWTLERTHDWMCLDGGY